MRLLEQSWRTPLASERATLGLRSRERALIREVLLLCHDTPWVFARSVFPARALRGPQRRLARLGTRPLGKVLFSTRGMHRAQVAVTDASPDDAMLVRCARELGHAPGRAWKRASVFRCRERALLVTELFLEAFASER